MQKPPRTVFKIVEPDAWKAACALEKFMGSPDDVRDGYIHLSEAHQIAGTLQRHFTGHARLLLAAYSEAELGSALRWEPSRGGENFPHYYDALPTSSTLWVLELVRDEQGEFTLPADVA